MTEHHPEVTSTHVPDWKTSPELTSPRVVGYHLTPASQTNESSFLDCKISIYFCVLWESTGLCQDSQRRYLHGQSCTATSKSTYAFLVLCTLRIPGGQWGQDYSHPMVKGSVQNVCVHPSTHSGSPRYYARLSAQACSSFSRTLQCFLHKNTHVHTQFGSQLVRQN